MKRAAIYVRVSSENQGGKSSPEEQERDCRAVADAHGLDVVGVYRDIARYRVRGKMVEPSGTRTDRPGLVAMILAARRGEFDTIIAWKEDRLYRAMKSMIVVLDVVQECRLDVLLARETFDARMAPVKAWVAGMELESIRERMTMGVQARLRAGNANTGQDRYGYRREGGRIVVVEGEARWVRQIFAWYLEEVPMMEIRRRLIEAGAPQKGGSVARKMQWGRHVIQGIIQAGEDYAIGVKRMSRAGEVYELPVEPIITMETWERTVALRAKYKTWPAHNVRWDYLVQGLLTCDCGRRWRGRTTAWRAKGVERKTPTGTYYCTQMHPEMRSANCPRTVGKKLVDDLVWGQVTGVLDEPELLLRGARQHVEGLRARVDDLRREREKLELELERSGEERQWVITQARKGRITEMEMDEQLLAIRKHEIYLRRELKGRGAVADLAGLDDWETAARRYLGDVRAGLDCLHEAATGEDELRAQFELRRAVVKTLVERVTIDRERSITVVFKIDIPALLRSNNAGDESGGEGVSGLALVDGGGIYSRR